MKQASIGFLFLGGAHQILHIAPVAMKVIRDGASTVRLFAAGQADRHALIELWHRFGHDAPDVEMLPRPLWARLLARAVPRWSAAKLPKLLASRALLAGLDAVVVAERTSTILKRIPGAKPYLIHVPHGAGDRARGFEPRIRLFDHVIVAGDKDRDRLIAEGTCRPADVSVSGYIKLAAVQALRATSNPPRLFDNDKPTVLYNPHFAKDLSSWPGFGDRLIAGFLAQDRFNLIVAPHVRLFENASSAIRHAVEARAVPGRVRIDLGSALSNDMTYTFAADIYVGDASSQVYEFLAAPKPCVFLNAGIKDWQSDPSFAFWHFGEVVGDPAEMFAAIDRASALHPRFAPVQVRAREQAFGPPEGDPIAKAADIVGRLALRRMRKTDTAPRSVE